MAWVLVSGGVAILAIVAIVVVMRWRRRRAQEDEPLVSLVVLRRTARHLDDRGLADMATRALGVDITSQDSHATAFVAGEPPLFAIKGAGLFLLLNDLDALYFDDTEGLADEVGELRLRKALLEHQAWLSVDLIHKDDALTLDDAHRLMARLVAELLDGDSLAVFSPETQVLRAVDDELREALLSDDPLAGLVETMPVPVVPVSGDDPRMMEAVAEARRRWPELVAAFERRQPDQHFAAKAPFGDPDDPEFMWLTVTGIDGDAIHGILDNDPVDVPDLTCGDPVSVQLEDLNDWLYLAGDEPCGGFTIAAIAEIQREGRQG